jgi:hypothetical protein
MVPIDQADVDAQLVILALDRTFQQVGHPQRTRDPGHSLAQLAGIERRSSPGNQEIGNLPQRGRELIEQALRDMAMRFPFIQRMKRQHGSANVTDPVPFANTYRASAPGVASL